MNSGPFPDPPVRHWTDLGDIQRGGFINRRADDPAWRQYLGEVLGEEGFACWQRSERLGESSRPLADTERVVLRRAAEPLLADLAASGISLPDIREEAVGNRSSWPEFG